MECSSDAQRTTMLREDKLMRDISGDVTLQVTFDKEGDLFSAAHQYFGPVEDHKFQNGQVVSAGLCRSIEQMSAKYEDLAPFNHSNIMKPLCQFVNDDCHFISYEPITCSLRKYLTSNRSKLVVAAVPAQNMYLHEGTGPFAMDSAMDFAPMMAEVVRMGLIGTAALHSEGRVHGTYDLDQMMVFVENPSHPVYERPILKLNPGLDCQRRHVPKVPFEAMQNDFIHYANAVLEMCSVLEMPDNRIKEITNMCERMKNREYYCTSDILMHACLMSHDQRKLKLKHTLQVSGEALGRGARGRHFPEGGWKVHFTFILTQLEFIPLARMEYKDNYAGFIDLARNIMSHFWEMRSLHRFLRDEVATLQMLRGYYPLLFVDID